MFHELKLKIPDVLNTHKKLISLKEKCVYIPVSEHFSFAKIKQHNHYIGAPCDGDNKIPV